MRTYILFFSFFLFLGASQVCNAQKSDNELHSIKIGLLTDRMHLTTEQSQKFWPIYNRYENDMRTIWKQKHAINDPNNHSKTKVDDLQRLEVQKVNIRGKYKNEFLKVISSQQLASMYQAEQEFKGMLLKRMNGH